MICFPNCKINLGLFITRKRDDGYHDLETVFYPLATRSPMVNAGSPNGSLPGLYDVLEIVPAAVERGLILSGTGVTGNKEENLVWKAYELLRQDFRSKIPALEIYLHKAIPMGAGMGGGSSDGAYMLRLINDYCKLNLSDECLAVYALQLGSDCPFFIFNTPQYATGRGEIMQPVNIDLTGYDIRVVCPDIHISTREAFSNIRPRSAPVSLTEIEKIPIEEWKEKITNDFEIPVFGAYPILADIKQKMYDQGALYASMTGTGSAIYGIFKK